MAYPERKKKVLKAFLDCFSKYDQAIIVDLLNISTKQVMHIRKILSKQKGTFLVGKNTIALLAIRLLTEDVEDGELKEIQGKYPRKPNLKDVIPRIVNKVAFIFTDTSYIELKGPIENEVIKVPAKPGVVAPTDVWVRAGPTSLDAGKFNEFQRLGIQTKTARQSIEIVKDIKICSKGELVSENVSSMCRMLNIIPFEYGMKIQNVYLNQQFIPTDIINLPQESIIENFKNAVANLSAISVEAGILNALSTPHIISNIFKAVLAIGIEANINMPILEAMKNSSAASTASAPDKKATESKKAEPAKKPEPEPEEADMDFGDMFG